MSEQKGINTVALLLFSIGMSLSVFTYLLFQGPEVKFATACACGIALMPLGIMPHSIGLNRLIKIGKTVPVVLVITFLGFWSYASIGLILSSIVNWKGPLLAIEPAMFVLVAGVIPWFKKNHPSIVPALWIIEVLLAHLWIPKVCWPIIALSCPYTSLTTTIAVFITAFYELYKGEKPAKKAEPKADPKVKSAGSGC